MQFSISSALIVASLWVLQGVAAPTGEHTTNALADFPQLSRDARGHSFMHVDSDGVYRSYHANGTVLDAARLNSSQIDTWLAAIAAPEGIVSASELDEVKGQLAGTDSLQVSDHQLFHPPGDVKPTKMLADFSRGVASLQVTPRAAVVGGLVGRQFPSNCPAVYCLTNPAVCLNYPGCGCNGVICV
ncbi:hypothetical protein SLS62_005063 [Diatrype stigma]|uniref:Uncharacterized protein n=1 Tax=Diatrype stigma TaxID=117547 RepID=A0AAN9UPL7_9PEZI